MVETLKGSAANIVERNKDEIEVKAVTQSNFPKESYNPATYLNPFGDQKAARSVTSQRAGSGLTVTSLHGAKIVNRKEHIK